MSRATVSGFLEVVGFCRKVWSTCSHPEEKYSHSVAREWIPVLQKNKAPFFRVRWSSLILIDLNFFFFLSKAVLFLPNINFDFHLNEIACSAWNNSFNFSVWIWELRLSSLKLKRTEIAGSAVFSSLGCSERLDEVWGRTDLSYTIVYIIGCSRLLISPFFVKFCRFSHYGLFPDTSSKCNTEFQRADQNIS